MEGEYVKSERLIRSANEKQPIKQGANIIDNRFNAVSQAQLINVIQRAASFQGGATIPPEIKNFRKSKMKIIENRRNTITVGGNKGEGFGMNAGSIDGGSVRFNIYQGVHTEPLLISKRYAGEEGDWNIANEGIRRRNNEQRDEEEPLRLYTERAPCRNCGYQLGNDIYKNSDMVRSSFVSEDLAGGSVAFAYIQEAEEKFPGYKFEVHPERSYHLQGTKMQAAVPVPAPARRDRALPGQTRLTDYFRRG